MTGLHKIGLKHGTDKATHHGYTHLYERYFRDLRDEAMGRGSLLELGVKQGQSLAMWRDWLPGWQITGIDNNAEGTAANPDGTLLLVGDQADRNFILDAGLDYGEFDIVIDDASHISSLSIKSFELLWPFLKPGGWYVVEDTHSSYHDFYYGSSEADEDPDVVPVNHQGQNAPTMMQFLKRLADQANFRGRDEWDLFPPKYDNGFHVAEVHFHFNICFVRKA